MLSDENDFMYETRVGRTVLGNANCEDEETPSSKEENIAKNTCFNCSGDHQVIKENVKELFMKQTEVEAKLFFNTNYVCSTAISLNRLGLMGLCAPFIGTPNF